MVDTIQHTNTEQGNRKKSSSDCTHQEHFSFKQHNTILHSNIENEGSGGIRMMMNSSSECSEFYPWSHLSPHTETNTSMKIKTTGNVKNTRHPSHQFRIHDDVHPLW
jgi:hypothetical protein